MIIYTISVYINSRIGSIYQMEKAKIALIWISEILKKHQVPFQISGGLAAISYGATRPLEDIDIDIPDNKFDVLVDEVKPYLIYGPSRFKSDKWDLLLMTLNYQGQEIDLSGADSTFIYNQQEKIWLQLNENLATAPMRNVLGINLPVIAKNDLLHYKKILAREVDLIDIAQMNI